MQGFTNGHTVDVGTISGVVKQVLRVMYLSHYHLLHIFLSRQMKVKWPFPFTIKKHVKQETQEDPMRRSSTCQIQLLQNITDNKNMIT